jgi:hypothetical protein
MKVDHKGTGCECVDRINLAEYSVQCLILVNTVKGEEFIDWLSDYQLLMSTQLNESSLLYSNAEIISDLLKFSFCL